MANRIIGATSNRPSHGGGSLSDQRGGGEEDRSLLGGLADTCFSPPLS